MINMVSILASGDREGYIYWIRKDSISCIVKNAKDEWWVHLKDDRFTIPVSGEQAENLITQLASDDNEKSG